MGEKLEDVFSRLSRKPKDLLTELKGLWLGNKCKELPPQLLTHGLTSKLLTGLQGHFVRELKRKNTEYVHVLLWSFHSALKHQVDEMEAEPSTGVIDRAADMIVLAFNKMSSEPSAEGQWAEVINLLASSASLLAVYQPKRLGECLATLMEQSQHQNLGVECRVKVCNAINELWEVYSPQIKEGPEARGMLEDHCKRWLTSLGKAGDYELQLQLLEAVFRVSDAKQRDLLGKMCFKDQQLATELKNINPKELDVGSRRFLNFLNMVEGSEASVSSVPCLLYQFGDIQLPHPPEIDQFWIDFNYGGRSMSTYIEDSWEGGSTNSSEDAPWISVVVRSSNVASYKLQAATDTIVLQFTLKQAAGSLVPTCPIRNDSTLLRLSFHGAHYDQLSQSLEKVFGRVTLFSPSLVLSTTTEVAAVQKRKVSQAPVHVLISSKRSYTPVCVVNKLQTPATADKAPCCNGTPAPEEASLQACLPSNKTTADTVMSETRVGGDKEGKVPSVPVSPIYASPVKSGKLTKNTASLATTPKGRSIPRCTPKTSTPRKQVHISAVADDKECGAGESKLRIRGKPLQQLNETGGTPSKHEEVRASRKKIVPLDVGVGKAPKVDPKTSTRPTNMTEQQGDVYEYSSPEGVVEPTLQKAEVCSREPRSRGQAVTERESQPTAKGRVPNKRPPLENITNVARDKGKKAPPPKKTKTAKEMAPLGTHVNALASEVVVDLEVIQDSIPQGQKGKTAKQTPAKPRYSKDKQPGRKKRHKSPTPALSRSLVHNLSANTSRCSSTMGSKDPYAFDSEDEAPDLNPADKPGAGKGKKDAGRKWHEEEEEKPSHRREKIRVYSNKGKAQRSFCLSVDSSTMSFNDSPGNSPPPVKSCHMDKPAGAAVVGYKGTSKGLVRQNTTLRTYQPQKKPQPQATKTCKKTRTHPSFSLLSEYSFNSHYDDSSDESYLPKGKKATLKKEAVKTSPRERPSSSNSLGKRPQRSCRRSSEQNSTGNMQHTTPANSQRSANEEEPGSGPAVQPSTRDAIAWKKTTPVSVPSSRKRKVEGSAQVIPRQVQKTGKERVPLHQARREVDDEDFQPLQVTPLPMQEGQVEISPPLSSGQEDEALTKGIVSPLCDYEDEGISEVIVSLPYHTRPQDREKMPRMSVDVQHEVGSSRCKPTGLEEDNYIKHLEAPQVSSPSLEELDNMEGSEPEEEEEEDVQPDVRELTLEFEAICKDVIAHSGNKDKKGGTSAAKNATKQKGRKRVALSKGESTLTKKRKDDTPASSRAQQGRVQSAKRTPCLPPPTPATEKAGFSHLMQTVKSGRGSYKWQAPHSRQSGREGKKQDYQRTELSPMQPIQYPSLESHSTCSSPREDSEDEVPSQPGISTQVQETLQPVAAVMQAKSATYRGSARQVAQKACKSTEKQTGHFWTLQNEKWQALQQHFSKDLLPLVSDIEEDVLGTCQAVDNMQKIMYTFGSEHKTLMDSLSSQNGRLGELSGAHRNLKKQWSASERDMSKKTAVLEGNLQKEVEHITKEAMAKSRQEQMDKIRRSVQTWLLFNM